MLGARYAAPPIGPKRFHVATPHPAWTGTRDATSYGAACTQNISAFNAIPDPKGCSPAACARARLNTSAQAHIRTCLCTCPHGCRRTCLHACPHGCRLGYLRTCRRTSCDCVSCSCPKTALSRRPGQLSRDREISRESFGRHHTQVEKSDLDFPLIFP